MIFVSIIHKYNRDVKTVSVWFQNKRQTEKKAGRLLVSVSDETQQVLSPPSPPKNIQDKLGRRNQEDFDADQHPSRPGREPFRVVNHENTSYSLLDSEHNMDVDVPVKLPQSPATVDMTVHSNAPVAQLKDLPLPQAIIPGVSRKTDSRQIHTAATALESIRTSYPKHSSENDATIFRMLDWACDRQRRKRSNREIPAMIEPETRSDQEGRQHPQVESQRSASSHSEYDSAMALLSLPSAGVQRLELVSDGHSEEVLRAACLLLCYKYSIQDEHTPLSL